MTGAGRVLPILRHPDPVLRRICPAVTAFDDDLAALARDMLATMYAAPGRGLAAPQIGRETRLFVMDVTWKDGVPDPRVLINPEITWRSGTDAIHVEGCLSVPGIPARVARPDTVTLRWQGLDGALRSETFTGMAAVCAQHEIDHLDGILCIDRALPDAAA